jgi:hypothetical protein
MECFPPDAKAGRCDEIAAATGSICKWPCNGLTKSSRQDAEAEIDELFGKYRLSEAMMAVYQIVLG